MEALETPVTAYATLIWSFMHVQHSTIFKYTLILFLSNATHKMGIFKRASLFQTCPITNPIFHDKERGNL